ncbi:MAG: PAS domain S-box protein [Magnetococcales bacterium]|nr:PAS domain S-box protein [Magnetococcales bacterium]
MDNPEREMRHLNARLHRLAEEKSNLQLIIRLIERLNTGQDLDEMVHQMLTSVVETIGGTDISIHYWIGEELHLASFLADDTKVSTITDPLVAQVAQSRTFLEQSTTPGHVKLHDGVIPGPWHWAFPLLVGEELIGVVKIENLQINSASLRQHLPIFFDHLALTLANRIRDHIRQRIQEALRCKTAELDRFFHQSLDLLCIADLQGYFRKLNPAWEETLGYSLIDLEGQSFLDFVHPDDLAATKEALDTLSRQLPVIHFVNRYRHKDGGERWIEWRARSEGELIYAAARDITQRMEMESNLLSRKRQFDELTSRIPVGVYTFRMCADESMSFDYVSDRFCHMLQRSREQIMQDANATFAPVHPEDLPEFIAANREARLTLNPFRWEGRFLIHNQVRWMLIESSGRRENNGDSIWEGVISDVTERHLFEEKLRQAKEAAEAGNRAKGEFLAAMSHEIRTPMNVVLGMAELLLETDLNPHQHHFAQTMHRSGKALLGVINDVLDFSRIESGHFQLAQEPFSPRRVLEDTVDLMRMAAEEKGLTMTEWSAPQIPESVLGDDNRVRQILINLLGNAIKFTTSGQIEVLLTPSPDTPDSLQFSVRDTGIGIAPEQLGQIFERFMQADTGITRRFGGTGLGLTISRRLVEMMGGTIRVESQLGAGSTFHFTLPVRTAQATVSPVVADTNSPTPNATRLNILLAEDVEENRILFEAYLQNTPHRLVMVTDGVEAVDQVLQEWFDVVIMDVQMPRMDGYTAIRQIRKWEQENGHPPLPIVTLSAHAMEGEVERCHQAGGTLYLTKPIGKKKLLSTLQDIPKRPQPDPLSC